MTPGTPLTLSPSQLLLEIATGHQHDSEADKVDLTPLKDLISGRTVGPDDGDRSSRAQAFPKGKAVRGEKDAAEGRAEGNAVVLNTASAQKHSLETRSRTDWPVLEIITLRFPTVESPHFTASRLIVNAWTSVDRRLILQRAQTVVRIETYSKDFGARTDFIDSVESSRRARAIAKAEALFDLV
ncbi:hypothetical protein FA13DRAFT_1527455 [Coprinellus micaceus]|uniref:Uncharacterized protein n=1 Tax=Coprinellus micaceus TaxID=71717 RepID=A0A4Y7SJC1_COPMI|nr:hypothetical protein FA13DRAFT_1527455 [Coprinellus micaceus]